MVTVLLSLRHWEIFRAERVAAQNLMVHTGLPLPTGSVVYVKEVSLLTLRSLPFVLRLQVFLYLLISLRVIYIYYCLSLISLPY